MDPSGGGKVSLARDDRTTDRHPAFSPDGTRIVFSRTGIGLFSMAAGGGAARQLTGGIDAQPDWGVAVTARR